MSGNTATSEPPVVSWHRIDETDQPAEGRVRSAVVDGRSVPVSRCGGRIGALANRCPTKADRRGKARSRTSLTEVDEPVPMLLTTPGPALLHVEQDGELV